MKVEEQKTRPKSLLMLVAVIVFVHVVHEFGLI